MITPELIMQQRELAQSLKELFRQNKQALDALQTAREREIASIEQRQLDQVNQHNVRFAEFLELERTARSKVRSLDFEAFNRVSIKPTPVISANASQTLEECKSETERILGGLADTSLCLVFVTVPSDVSKDAILAKWNAIPRGGVVGSAGDLKECPKKGEHYSVARLEIAQKAIAEMKALGVEVELAV